MSTRATIGIINSKGKEKRIYCHNDGYLDGVGETLLKFWNSADKVNELMKFGSISSLGKYPTVFVIGQPPKDPKQHRYGMYVWNENDVDPQDVGGTYGGKEEYDYTWKNGRWYVEFLDENNKRQNLPLEIAILGFEGHKTKVPAHKKCAKKAPFCVNVRNMF